MKLGLQTRRWLAVAGPLLWIAAGSMTLFGGAAKHSYQCRSRTFTGQFDECFNDALPVELITIPFTILTVWLFYWLSRSIFGVSKRSPAGDRYSLNQPPNGAHLTAAVGVAWTLWRALTYPFVTVLLPYILFWFFFAAWFALGAAYGWFGSKISSDNNDRHEIA